MTNALTKATHEHVHGDCDHPSVRHEEHVDYLHDGELHSFHLDHIDRHRILVNGANPTTCTGGHTCAGHEAVHVHGGSCGHAVVPHGDHTDYLVDAHLHHAHSGHCDDHGALISA